MWERKTIFVSLSDEDVWELWLFLEGVGTCAPEPEPEPGEPAGFKDRCCSEAWMTLDPRSCGGTPEAEPGRRSHTHGFNQVFIVVKGLHTSPWRRICVSITNKPSAVNFSHTWTCVCVCVLQTYQLGRSRSVCSTWKLRVKESQWMFADVPSSGKV